MAWQSVFPIMVRNLIGDITTPQKYTDDQLNETVLVAAMIVSQEFPFSNSYTIDFASEILDPDPTEPLSPTAGPDGDRNSPTQGLGFYDPSKTTFDPVAISLFSLKAACILNTSSFTNAVGRGIRVKDGDSEVDTVGNLRSWSDILKYGVCSSYASLLKRLYTTRGQNLGKCVMSPYSLGNGPIQGNRSPFGNWSPISFFNNFLRF